MDALQESARRAAQEATDAPIRHAAVYGRARPMRPHPLDMLFQGLVALSRWRRSGTWAITVALTDDSVLLLDTRVRHARRHSRRLIAQLPLASIRCRPVPEQPWAFELDVADGERWRLYPKWDTPDVVAIAEQLRRT